MGQHIRKATLFTALTFLVNWSLVALFLALGGRWYTPAGYAFGAAYMFIPMVAAVLVQKGLYRQPVRKPLGISFRLNRWFLVAWLLPPVLAVAAFALGLLVPGVEYSLRMEGLFARFGSVFTPAQLEQLREQMARLPLHPFWLALLQGLIAGVTVNAVAGFGEELGWRGLLQSELAFLGFWKSSFLIGLVWGVWHAPLILLGHNYPQHPAAGVFMMTIWALLLGPIFSYVRVKAKSVIAAAIMHGSLNATYALSIMLVKGGNDLTTGLTGLPGFAVLAAVILALFLYDPAPAEPDTRKDYGTERYAESE